MTVLDHTVHDLPTTGWATARGGRRVPADTAAARTSPGRFAIAVADGVGDTPEAVLAARLAVDAALDEAWAADVTGVPPAVRHTLDSPTPPIAVPATRPAPDDTATRPGAEPPTAADATKPTTTTSADPNTFTPADGTRVGDTTYAVAAGDARRGWSVVWVGDCRAYFVPLVPDTPAGHGPALPLTTDHTIGQYLRDRDVRANPSFDRVVTTTARKGVPGITAGPPGAGRLVLLTNGVHHHVDPDMVAHIARTVPDPAAAAAALVAAAYEAGGTDNAAAAVADLR